MHKTVGPYRTTDIEVVAAFDIDRRKVGKPVGEAIYAAPNNTFCIVPQLKDSGPIVQMGPVLDGFAEHMQDYPEHQRFALASQKPADVVAVLRDSGADILVNYLPVGSQKATEFYAQAALDNLVAVSPSASDDLKRWPVSHFGSVAISPARCRPGCCSLRAHRTPWRRCSRST